MVACKDGAPRGRVLQGPCPTETVQFPTELVPYKDGALLSLCATESVPYKDRAPQRRCRTETVTYRDGAVAC